MKYLKSIVFFLLYINFTSAQDGYYFPEQNAKWEEKLPKDFKIDLEELEQAVGFAENNEYSGSRDLRIAILKGFEREPFHKF